VKSRDSYGSEFHSHAAVSTALTAPPDQGRRA